MKHWDIFSNISNFGNNHNELDTETQVVGKLQFRKILEYVKLLLRKIDANTLILRSNKEKGLIRQTHHNCRHEKYLEIN